MLIDSSEKYVSQLRNLWHKVFSDELSYIDLFFKSAYKNCKTFAAFDGEKIVSVFYLLDCKIRFENHLYSGYYLYAAATDPDYRKRGLMGSLINEGFEFAKENGKDYISLVPGNKPLYDYYSKFGFQTAMYKCVDEIGSEYSEALNADFAETDEYEKIRFSLSENAFLWEEKELSYVFDCFDFYNISRFKCGETAFIANKEESVINELICKNEAFFETAEKICAFLSSEKITVHSPNGKNKIPFGMILPINKKLSRQWSFDDIYMNLALD